MLSSPRNLQGRVRDIGSQVPTGGKVREPGRFSDRQGRAVEITAPTVKSG